MFSFYTTRNDPSDQRTGGEVHQVFCKNNRIGAELVGPENPFRKDNAGMKLPFVVKVENEHSAKLLIDGARHRLLKDVYSEWIHVAFRAAPGVKVHGVCRFLLLSAKPEFSLYVTPINLDPEKPAMPISYPVTYSTYLAKRQGAFATLGLAEDSWALNEKILDYKAFLQQCVDADGEREQMFFDCLDKVKRGLCVCVFDGTDRVQHTFWRDVDAPRIVDGKEVAQPPDHVLDELYQRMDALVGRVVEKCKGDHSVLMIVSDHGFNSFRRGVDLNRWLEINGYLKVKEGARSEKYLTAIDWSQTKAFAVGLAGMFLNIRGRQSQGIVAPGAEAASLCREIAEKLGELTDPDNNQAAVKTAYVSSDVYRGPYADAGPDIIVGYQRGYRASWETAIGQVTNDVFHTNTKAWNGDHCIDHTLVPGVLFCNKNIETEEPRLMDIGATVLDMFGVAVPNHMDGKPLTLAY